MYLVVSTFISWTNHLHPAVITGMMVMIKHKVAHRLGWFEINLVLMPCPCLVVVLNWIPNRRLYVMKALSLCITKNSSLQIQPAICACKDKLSLEVNKLELCAFILCSTAQFFVTTQVSIENTFLTLRQRWVFVICHEALTLQFAVGYRFLFNDEGILSKGNIPIHEFWSPGQHVL